MPIRATSFKFDSKVGLLDETVKPIWVRSEDCFVVRHITVFAQGEFC